MLCQCKIVYLELLNELPFDKMSRLTPEKLIEQIFAVAFNDYQKRKMESALAYHVRQLVEDED